MSWLSSIVKKAAPIIATVSPEPISRTVASGLSYQYQQQDINYQRKLAEQQQKQQRERAMEIFGTNQNLRNLQAPMVAPTTQQAGFGAGFGQFLGDVGRNIVTPFAGLASAISPFFGRSVQQQPAISTTRGFGAQETQGSGSIQAGMGGLVGTGLQAAGRFLRSPTGQIGTGLLGGGLLSMIDSQPSGMRITRKMKSQARTVLNMTGGNLSAAADILGISEEMLVQVLLKRFRNDGPVVTKAALRKTKQTVRRLKSMCDMYDDLRPRAAARRRAPVRRSTTTLIKN